MQLPNDQCYKRVLSGSTRVQDTCEGALTFLFFICGLESVRPQMHVTPLIRRNHGSRQEVKLSCRVDTSIEVDYYHHGGILAFVLRELLAA